MRSHLDIKTLLVLMVIVVALGYGMAKLAFTTQNPLVKTNKNAVDTIPYQFPDTPDANPFNKDKPITTSPTKGSDKPEKLCVHKTTAALNRKTMQIQQFPGTCDVPAGWEILY